MNTTFLKYIFKLTSVLLAALLVTSCSNLDESALKINTDNKVIYSETFATTVGKFTEVSVVGNQKWEYSATYGCMVITGFVDTNGDGVKENIENEDWLISPEVDLSGLSAAKLTFDHAGNYFATVSNSTTLWISEDYKDGLPSTGTWTQLSITKDVTNKDFTFVTPEISLTSYAGKKVRIALKYNSTVTKAGTWEVKNFAVKSGEAVVEPVVDNGKGTEASPYNVAGAIGGQGTSAWVRGYVLGYVWSGSNTSYVFGADTCTQATNILIGDTVGSIYLSKCVAVQLPTGAIRNAFNLTANKNLIGQKITLYGSLESYFGSAGLKNVTYGMLPNGTAVGTKPVEPIYSETFASNSQGAFTVKNVTLPSAITSVWLTSSSYGMVATAFKTPTNYDAEGWLISPEIDLTNQATAKMKFDHAINFVAVANISNEMTVQISIDGGANWTKLTVPTYPVGTNWTFVNSGEINLQAYVGKKIKIAFKYMSTATKAGTWEVKNFIVYK